MKQKLGGGRGYRGDFTNILITGDRIGRQIFLQDDLVKKGMFWAISSKCRHHAAVPHDSFSC